MIPKECNACAQRSAEKLSSLYWAWNRADGTRVAWLQKLCVTCFSTQVLPLVVAAMEPVLICPACGIGTVDDYDAVYAKIYVPGQPPFNTEMPLCGPCAATVRGRAMNGATQLEDREARGLGATSGPQPVSSETVWASLGLAPQ